MYQPHKILVIASHFPTHQADKQSQWLQVFYDRLACYGHQVVVLAPTIEASYTENRNGVQIEWFSCPFASTFMTRNDAAEGLRTRKLLEVLLLLPYVVMYCVATFRCTKGRPFDVIHVHSAFPDGLIGLFVRYVNSASVIFLAHEEVEIDSAWTMSRYFQFFTRSADMLIANSPELAIAMKRHTPRRWNLLEYDTAPKMTIASTELDREPRIMVLVDPKGFSASEMLQVISKVNDQHAVKFYFSGLGSSREEFESLIEALRSSFRIEMIDDFESSSYRKALGGCDLCVLVGASVSCEDDDVSRNFILDAYQYSKPVVATDSVNIRDVVIDDVTGFRVPLGDFVALADSINNLIVHPFKRERFGKAGFNLRQETVAWDSIISELEDLQCIASGLQFRLQPIAYSKRGKAQLISTR